MREAVRNGWAAWRDRVPTLSRRDAVLLGAALAGLVLFLAGLPRVHPDTTARATLRAEGAREHALRFAEARGYDVAGHAVRAYFRRNSRLVSALHDTLGAVATVARLRREPAAMLPAYFWEVGFGTAGEAWEVDEAALTVQLTEDGAVWAWQSRLPEPERPAVERRALGRVLPAAEGLLPGALPASDSLLAARLFFNPADSLWQRANPTLAAAAGPPDPAARLETGLEPADAVALARYHLEQTAWAGAVLRVDSLWTPGARGNRQAVVRFRPEETAGPAFFVDVEVAATGTLQALQAELAPEAGVARRAAWSTAVTAVQLVTLGLLALALLVVFFQRLAKRLVDGRAAILDALACGVFFALFLGLLRDPGIVSGAGEAWQVWLARVVTVSFASGAVALFTFLVSGGADSVARAVWPKKLRALSLVRLGSLRNLYVGTALLRGIGLACVLLGVLVALLWTVPGLYVDVSGGELVGTRARLPLLWAVATSLLVSYLMVMLLPVGVGTFFRRFGWRPGALVVAITLLGAATGVAFTQPGPPWAAWVGGALTGLALGAAVVFYDVLTALVLYAVGMLLWALVPGLWLAGSTLWVDALLALGAVVGLEALGIAGVLSNRREREVADYEPAYVTEMAQRERLTRELEIAHQVQASFLPRTMPALEGLDVAAMCLAAQEVGGDYYDFIELGPQRLGVVVGDVSGKGIQAAFYMTLVKGFVQTLARDGVAPAELMRRVNRLFCANAPRGVFISLVYGVLDVAARSFTFARAGHNPIIFKQPLLRSAELLRPDGLAIGLTAGARFDAVVAEQTLALSPGDVLVFYTDGFSEAMNARREVYGDERLAARVRQLSSPAAADILHAVADDVHRFMQGTGRHDDMTMMVVRLAAPAHYGLPASAPSEGAPARNVRA